MRVVRPYTGPDNQPTSRTSTCRLRTKGSGKIGFQSEPSLRNGGGLVGAKAPSRREVETRGGAVSASGSLDAIAAVMRACRSGGRAHVRAMCPMLSLCSLPRPTAGALGAVTARPRHT